jgi:acetyltransferase-like isoleucine patch superfamily enzyme
VPSAPTTAAARHVARALRRLRREAGTIRTRGLPVWLFYLPGPGPRLMSWLRKRWVLLRNPHAHIEFRGPVYLGPHFSLDMPRGGTFIVGPATEFRRGFRAEFGGPETRIVIGSHVVFTYDVIIQCSSSVEIGDHCQFGQNTLIVDGNHRFKDLDRPMLEQGYDLVPITIADHAVVTTKCTIIAGIGERTYVGANSVVTRELPAYCVAAGAPARVIEYFGPPGQEPPEITTLASEPA